MDAAGTIRIPITGCYVISQTTTLPVNAYDKQAFCMVNTLPTDAAATQTHKFASHNASGAGQQFFSGTGTVFLNAGDLLRVWVYLTTATGVTPVEIYQRNANYIALVRTA
jgi:hypothetical protein